MKYMNIELYESLNEKQQRLYLGELAAAHGYGGIAKISREYNVSREKVKRGLEGGEENVKPRNILNSKQE